MTAAKANLAPLPAGVSARLLTREQVATYLGVSPGVVDQLVDSGELPPPVPWSKRPRRWDVRAIDRALDSLSGAAIESTDDKWRQAALDRLKALDNGRSRHAVRHP